MCSKLNSFQHMFSWKLSAKQWQKIWGNVYYTKESLYARNQQFWRKMKKSSQKSHFSKVLCPTLDLFYVVFVYLFWIKTYHLCICTNQNAMFSLCIVFSHLITSLVYRSHMRCSSHANACYFGLTVTPTFINLIILSIPCKQPISLQGGIFWCINDLWKHIKWRNATAGWERCGYLSPPLPLPLLYF